MLAEKLIIWKSKLYDLQIDVSRTQIWIFMEYNGISFFFICNKDTHEILRLWILVYRAGFWDMTDWSEKKSDHQKVFFGISTFTWYPVLPPALSIYISSDFSKRHTNSMILLVRLRNHLTDWSLAVSPARKLNVDYLRGGHGGHSRKWK